MRLARPLAGATMTTAIVAGLLFTAAPAAAEPAPCDATARACVDLSEGTAWLMDGGAVTYGPVRVTAGGQGHRTPTGRFAVTYKDEHHRSRAYDNAPMPNAVFFTRGGVAFHEGDRNSRSHGCVRLSAGAAAEFFRALQPGDAVQVRR
ncbi:L,D-transpeptidase [Pseudonocardia zijingensis]|uniref:L,D-transpeptidase n=1 Tax=Pseudonocardia zijingensis TaxID=153376 RepID=A0ABN1PM58_9PSEU